MKIVARAVRELSRRIGLCKGRCLADAAGDQGQDRPECQVPTGAGGISILDWLHRFASCMREVDYTAARPFWHPEIIIGT